MTMRICTPAITSTKPAIFAMILNSVIGEATRMATMPQTENASKIR